MIFTRITDRKCPIARYLFYVQIDIETHLLISALSWLIFFHRDLTYTFHQMFGHMKIRAVCLVWENDASYIWSCYTGNYEKAEYHLIVTLNISHFRILAFKWPALIRIGKLLIRKNKSIHDAHHDCRMLPHTRTQPIP